MNSLTKGRFCQLTLTSMVDLDGNDLIEARVTHYDIVDKGGTRMSIGMGGIIPGGEEPVHVLTSHEESCFAAGDIESKVVVGHESRPNAGLD